MSGCKDCNGLSQKGCTDGIGISTTVDNHDGTFTLYYTDGSTFTTSNFTGPQGPPGINGWLLTGNAGTNPATNFLGTIDNQPLILRTNNIISGVISPINANTSIGISSLLLNNGSYNTSLGYNNLFSLTTGQFNLALGNNSLRVNSTGNSNIAIGNYALATNRGKSNSIAIGTDAMQNADNSSSTGNTFNIAIGYKALFGSNSAAFNTGTNNVAIGAESMKNNTSGSLNVAFGTSALSSNTIGSQNTAIGSEALSTNISGGFNTAVGYRALELATGNSNTGLGRNALSQCTGDKNIGIGEYAASTLTSGNDNIVIGNNAQPTIASNSNIIIGQGATTDGVNHEIVFGSNTYYVGTTGNATGFATTATNFAGGESLAEKTAKYWKVRINDVTYKIPVFLV